MSFFSRKLKYMQSQIRIGTRDSALALYQANTVKDLLQQKGFSSILVPVKSEGDIDLKTPLYQMGVQGIFTRSLDIALLNNKIDIAVHSMKDVPTNLPEGIVQVAVLDRGNPNDVLVPHPKYSDQIFFNTDDFFNAIKNEIEVTIASSSVRRRAQWLRKYPAHQLTNIRGNVQTRLKKLAESNWQGAIFASAGLERVEALPKNAIQLKWMLPAPAQAAIVVLSTSGNAIVNAACDLINIKEVEICTSVERTFLNVLMGGCTTPISALAEIKADEIYFTGNVLSLDGKQKLEIIRNVNVSAAKYFGIELANELKQQGAAEIIAAIKK